MDDHPDQFRLVNGGFTGVKGTVAFESLTKPHHYLRHKNYRFHLQKFQNTTVFGMYVVYVPAYKYFVLTCYDRSEIRCMGVKDFVRKLF